MAEYDDYQPGGKLHPSSWRGVPLTTLIRLLRENLETAPPEVLRALSRRVDVMLLYRIRGAVSKSHPNEGDDIVTMVRATLSRAILDPGSADYRAISSRIDELIDRRVKDELRRLSRQAPAGATRADQDVEGIASPHDSEAWMEIRRALNKVTDQRKVAAFRMWSEGATKAAIASALGKNPTTIGDWIKEVVGKVQKELGP